MSEGRGTCEEAERSHAIVFILRLFLSRCHSALLRNSRHCGRTARVCVFAYVCVPVHMHAWVCLTGTERSLSVGGSLCCAPVTLLLVCCLRQRRPSDHIVMFLFLWTDFLRGQRCVCVRARAPLTFPHHLRNKFKYFFSCFFLMF